MPPPRASLHKGAYRAVLNGATQRCCVRKFAVRIASRCSEFFHGDLRCTRSLAYSRLSVKHVLCNEITIYS